MPWGEWTEHEVLLQGLPRRAHPQVRAAPEQVLLPRSRRVLPLPVPVEREVRWAVTDVVTHGKQPLEVQELVGPCPSTPYPDDDTSRGPGGGWTGRGAGRVGEQVERRLEEDSVRELGTHLGLHKEVALGQFLV